MKRKIKQTYKLRLMKIIRAQWSANTRTKNRKKPGKRIKAKQREVKKISEQNEDKEVKKVTWKRGRREEREG